MILSREWIVLDTNIWVFGLRGQASKWACVEILENLGFLKVQIPRQILLELRANLSRTEFDRFFDLINIYSDRLVSGWEKPNVRLVEKYKSLGCKTGDSVVAAHAEELEVKALVSENRHFLHEIDGLPFQVLSAGEAMEQLKSEVRAEG